MGRISATFKRLRWEKEAALMPALIVGYPSLDLTRQLVPLMGRQGADIIELGVPFNGSLSGDAAMQRASKAALRNGISLDECLGIAADSRRANEIPLVAAIQHNLLQQHGLERVVRDCASAGVDGLSVPDIPLALTGEVKALCMAAGVDLILTVTSDNTEEEIGLIAEMSSGFIYCVSLTGAASALSEPGQGINDLLTRARQHTDLPLVARVVISMPDQVALLTQQAEGAIVSGALVDLIESLPQDEVLYSVGELIRDMKAATIQRAKE